MSLILNDDQRLLSSTINDFVREQAPLARLRQFRQNRDLPGYSPQLWRQMADLGFTGLSIPEALGGSGLGFRELCLLLEAVGSRLMPEPVLSTVVLGTQALLLGDNVKQQQELLPAVAQGKALLTLAWQEVAGRYERRHVSLTATTKADGYVLSGEKNYVLDGHAADYFIVSARNSGAAASPKGITLFLVPKSASGLSVQRLHQIDERNVATLRLNNVGVGKSAVLGKIGGGGNLLDAILDRGTIALAAEMLGATQAAFDLTLAYLKQRIQFDVPIGSFQALQHRAARMFVQLALARSAVLAAAHAVDHDPAKVPELATLAKAKLSDTMTLVCNEGVQMHGGVGVTDEYDIGFYLKRARAADALLGDASWHRSRWAKLKGY